MGMFLLKILQGILIGLGAVLPGISGGVLCVVFGIYKPVMELLSAPFHHFKTHVPKLLPVIFGAGMGFLGIAGLLAYFLEKYPAPSVCLFVGLIAGMLPSLWKEAGLQGRKRGALPALIIGFGAVTALLGGLQAASLSITPGFGWYLFCGFCLALSLIAPGMSFSTLLMPLGLYTPFVDGISRLDFYVLLPGGIGAILTVILFSKAMNVLFERHYPAAFHAITGIVTAATLMVIPYKSFAASTRGCMINIFFLAAGVAAAQILDSLNARVPKDS